MSGERLLLDTKAIVALLQGDVRLVQLLHRAEWIGISVISRIEFLVFTGLTESDRQLFEQFLERVERSGKGWNLCLQTLDGILCHDGEIHNTLLEPIMDKTFESHDIEILHKKENPAYPLTPMTLEGCVVRMADTIAYIGRDIEDAIRLGVIRRADLPDNCVQRLGETNGTIVYSLVTDVIENSFHQPYITFSGPISEALKELKQFNLEKIYLSPLIKKYYEDIKSLFHILFEQFDLLGIIPDRISIAIYNENKRIFELWATDQSGIDFTLMENYSF